MAFYFYQALPDKIATHWNADGIADGFGGKDIGLFLIPIIGIFIIILFVFLPRIDPLKSKVGDYSPLMKKIGILALAFLVYLQGAIIYSNLRYKFSTILQSYFKFRSAITVILYKESYVSSTSLEGIFERFSYHSYASFHCSLHKYVSAI